MADSSQRKIVISVVGLAVVLGLAIAGYMFVAKPKLKQWGDDRKQIKKREKTLNAFRKSFGEQKDPNTELRLLKTEVLRLIQANKTLERIKIPGVEKTDFPEELKDKDPAIEKELFRNYMEHTMDAQENALVNMFKEARIPPPDIELYEDLSHADEAAYYTNRAAGLKGIVSALAKTASQGNAIIVEDIEFEDYKKGRMRSKGVLNVLSYSLDMTVNAESMAAFLYNLKEEKGYYYVETIEMEPSSKHSFSKGGDSGGMNLSVSAKINTTMVFESKIKRAVSKATTRMIKAAGKRPGGGAKKGSGMGGIFGMASGMQSTLSEEEERARQKKWWQFCKR